MSSSRPGGLTALALINIVLGLFATLGAGAGYFLPDMTALGKSQLQQTLQMHQQRPFLTPEDVAEMEQSLRELEAVEKLYSEAPWRWHTLTTANLVTSLLMFVSGFGLWRMRAVSGRLLGNLYVLTSIGAAILGQVLFRGTPGYEFSLFMLLGPVYGLLFLYLVNVVFAADFD